MISRHRKEKKNEEREGEEGRERERERHWCSLPGPKMTAFQSMMLSGHGAPEIPPGGSLCRRLKSFINLRRDDVDILY